MTSEARSRLHLLMLAVLLIGCPPPPGVEDIADCADDLDNDGDGAIDCDDVDCGSRFDCGGGIAISSSDAENFPLFVDPVNPVLQEGPRPRWGGDLDGDGRSDVGHLRAEYGLPDTLHLVLWNGANDTHWQRTTATTAVPDVDASCDVNGDGIEDILLLSAEPDAQGLEVYLGGKRLFVLGTWPQPDHFVEGSVGSLSHVLCPGDIDGDEVPDIVVTWASHTDLIGGASVLQDSPAVISSLDELSIPVQAGDVDKDGRPDVYLQTQLGFFENGPREEGAFIFSSALESGPDPLTVDVLAASELQGAHPVAFGDVGGDGTIDMLRWGSDGRYALYGIDSSALFIDERQGRPLLTDPGIAFWTVDLSDMNGNGLPELVGMPFVGRSAEESETGLGYHYVYLDVSPERPFHSSQVDLGFPRFGASWVGVVEDRNGDGWRDIGLAGNHRNVPGLPIAGFYWTPN